MANDLAVQLDRTGKTEVSCIAGIGGDVSPLVTVATTDRDEGRPILVMMDVPWNVRNGVYPDIISNRTNTMCSHIIKCESASIESTINRKRRGFCRV